MGIGATLRVEVQLTTGVWTDLTADTNAVDGLSLRYGIQGNGPLDGVAGTGEARVTLQNWATVAGRPQGYYSPLHASVLTGWTFGIPLQIVFSHGSDAAASVTSITRASTTATVTMAAVHGRTTGDYMTISGATEAEYNGTWQITVTSTTAFTFTISSAATTPATGTITGRRAYVKHRGKVRVIDPDTGAYRAQRVQVTSYDGIRDLAETDLRSVTLQTSKTETELVTALLDALPTASQPVARDFDTGVDTFPYAFDELGPGVKALSVIKDVADSAFAIVAMRGDGTLMLLSRNTRAMGASAYTFSNTMHALSIPTSLDNVYNRVRVTIHPRTISAAATEALYALPTGAYIEIPAAESRDVWTDYTDPNDRQTRIGGASVVTALVGGTHYTANTAANGSGSVITGDISASITPFASTAKWTLTNNGAVTAYIIAPFTVIGKALRDPAPQTFEATSTQSYGTRDLDVNLRYQSNSVIAQSYATYLEAQYHALTSQIEAIEFIANDSTDFLTQALAREPGDIITVTETVSGLVSVDAVIQSVALDVVAGPWIRCRFGLAPAAPFQAWLLGVVGRSELGSTTRLGF